MSRVQPPSSNQSREPLILLAGDSIFSDIKTDLLGKNRVKVENISHGGDYMNKTEAAIIKFSQSLDPKYEVQKIFLSIGTNDIRYCFGKGVDQLRGPLKRLVLKIKDLFPNAKVFIQSVLPQQVQNPWTIKNVLGMNALIKSCCYEQKVYYINSFEDFLLPDGRSNSRLFDGPVHPTRRAMGLIASRFIRIIHPRTSFNPEIF